MIFEFYELPDTLMFMAKQSQNEIREEITNKFIKALENGITPWRRPWELSSDPNCGLPENLISKKLYRGINPLILDLSSLANGFRSQWWATFNQFKSLGGFVKKGQKGTGIVFWRRIEIEDDKKKDGSKKKIFLLRFYTVFNLDQVEDKEGKLDKYRPAKADPTADVVPITPDYQLADEIVLATKADIRYGGNRACYHRPSGAAFPKHTDGDFIQMPNSRQFPDQRDFHDTRLHEIVHWSECRRKWTGTYAMGELIAEIGATYLSRYAKIPQSEDLSNHSKYVKSWLKEMKNDPKWIFRASTEASKAADYILHFSQKVEGYKEGDEISAGATAEPEEGTSEEANLEEAA
jgi:antirestriction protein ArdC